MNYFISIYQYQNFISENSKNKILYEKNVEKGKFFQEKLSPNKDKINEFNNYLKNVFFEKKNTISVTEFNNKLASEEFKNNLENFYGFLIDSLFYVSSNLKTIFVNFALNLTNYYINEWKNYTSTKKEIKITLSTSNDLFKDIQNNLNSHYLFYDSKISDIFDHSYQIINNVNLPLPSELYFYFDPEGHYEWFPFNPFIVKRNTIIPILKSKVSINFSYCYNILTKTTTNERIFFGSQSF